MKNSQSSCNKKRQSDFNKTYKKNRTVLAALLLFISFLTINSIYHPFINFDNIWLDFAVKQWSSDSTADPEIVVIDIDDPSLQAMKNRVGRWPWPRSVHAELLEQLQLQQPKAVIFDILFAEPDIYRPDADKYLSEVISDADNIFLPILHLNSDQPRLFPKLIDYPPSVGLTVTPDSAQTYKQTRANLLLPAAVNSDAWKLGTINFYPDPDGVGRRYQIQHPIELWRIDSLPTKAARYLGARIPEQKEIILDWHRAASSGSVSPYATYSYAAIYKAVSEEQTFIHKNFFHNKIIIIGSTATGLHDIKNTPVSGLFPAVYILATALDNLLHGQQLSPVPVVINLLAAILFLLLLTLGLLLAKRILPVALAFLMITLCYYLVSYQLTGYKFLMTVNSPMMIISGYFFSVLVVQFLQRQREYTYAIDIFGRFMDRNVVRQLVDSGETEQALHAKSCKITVLFSDIRNFTTLSEKHTALEIVQLLDDYFSMQVRVIFRHQGTLDKFIGDAIMAFWGAPLENENQEIQAVEAALTMVEQLERFRLEQKLPDFNIGIGIHTGEGVVGAIGGEQRYDYTVIGDTVNVASRIEGVTKNRCNILISEATRNACRDHFDFIELGSYTLKGREEPVTVFIPKRHENMEIITTENS
ncbi:adenylate/guanylate cyclase domain-containing protein [Psychromonas ossibalaenae]|uniref:adenylate/guanylate cyclase domain-containing protein n=1 Tax=Psychromonas ossibalaenae TaxID=444922 RepID=UPI000372B803|nr:adenylate/guanylate cyclase domain-containing protein [Psychromonas ossibalaenae]